MTKYARITALSLLLNVCIYSGACGEGATAPDPRGDWRVKDGTAHIRIVSCGEALWGVISWTRQPGTDENNPDAAKRNRSVLGMPILVALKPESNNRWKGEIYNAENGKTYQGGIRLQSADMLHVEGCVLGVLCGGEDWTRLALAPDPEASAAACRQVRK